MGNHKPGSGSGSKAAGDNRRDAKQTAKADRIAKAATQMERKPFENGG